MQRVPVLVKDELKPSGTTSPKKLGPHTKPDNEKFNLKLILEKYIGDENKFDFDYFISVLKQRQNDEDFLKIFLTQLRQSVHMLDPKLFENSLINFICFEVKWYNLNPELFKYLSEFLIDLNSAYTSYIYKTLTMLIKYFQINKESRDDAKLIDKDRTELYKMCHTIINHLVKIAPFCKTHLVKQIDTLYPYMNKETNVQEAYIKNILNVIQYISELRLPLLEICIQKMLKIDVNCRREQILEAELEPVIAIATATTTTTNESDNITTMKHELADRLDTMMDQVFLYMKTNCESDIETSKDETQVKLNWESTKLIYKDLLYIFDKYILSTYGSSHVQFLMFYICSHRGMLSEGFVDYLWKKFNYSTSSPVTRQICAYYIGSLLSRAKFVSLTTCVATLQLIVSWIRSYIEKTSASNSHSNFELHRTFYALCQTLFYVIIFRHRQLFQENQADILDLVKSWKLNSIVTSKLNPLKYCMKTVRKKFARIAYMHQIAYCYTILDANNRMSIPDAVESNLNMFFAGDSMIKSVNTTKNHVRSNFDNPLDSFFPFDPYLLKRSKRFIEKFYQEFQDDLEDDVESESDEDDDEDEEPNDDEDNEEDNASADDNDNDCVDDDGDLKVNSNNVKKYLSTSHMDDSDIDEDTMDE